MNTSKDDPLLFSVIIPAYNASRTLSTCLESVLKCCEKSSEIIVVDDGSLDETALVAKSFPVRLVKNGTTLGPAGARNKGSACAKGEFLVFIDSDIVVDSDLFSNLRAFFSKHNEAAAVSGHYSAPCPVDGFFSKYKNYYLRQSYSWMSGKVGVINTSLSSVKKNVFLNLGGFDTRWRAAEDTIFGAELASAGHAAYIDFDIQMRHLKEYHLFSLLKDDFVKSYYMAKYLWSKGIRIPSMLRRRIGHHHSWSQMARIPAAYASFLSLAVFLFQPADVPLAILIGTTAAFILLAWPLLRSLFKIEGFGFSLKSMLLHWIEMLISGAACLAALLQGVAFRSEKRMI